MQSVFPVSDVVNFILTVEVCKILLPKEMYILALIELIFNTPYWYHAVLPSCHALIGFCKKSIFKMSRLHATLEWNPLQTSLKTWI